jgi:ABC-type sugar transport system substrate-binding protein
MTKREKVLAISGVVLLAFTFAGHTALLRATRVEWPEPVSRFAGEARSSQEPRVILGNDSGYWRVKNAIRIDVLRGVPHMRDVDGTPITDLTAYVDAEAAKIGAEWVVISASKEEKIGGVIAVIDDCRKARVKGIVLNAYWHPFASK